MLINHVQSADWEEGAAEELGFIAMLPASRLFAFAFNDADAGGASSSISWCCAKRYRPFIIV